MKKLILVLFILLGIPAIIFAQIQSNGTGGGDWNTGTTWIGGVVPIVSDNVVIQGSDVVTLAATGTCANLTMNAGTKITIALGLALPGSSWTLDPTSTVQYQGVPSSFADADYGNLIYDGANYSLTVNLKVHGDLTVTTATLRGNGATSGSLTHNVTGNVFLTGASSRISAVNNSGATSASCTWNIGGNVTLSGVSTGNRLILQESAGPHTGTTIFNIDGNLTIGTSSQLQFRSSTNANAGTSVGQVNIKGNVIVNGTISSSTGGTGYNHSINLVGTSVQQWTGNFPNSFGAGQTMTFNINGAGVTLNNPVTVNSNVTLSMTNGKLTTTNTNLVTVSSSGAVAGGSSSSFVDGPLAHTIASTSLTTKTFPIGKGTAYRPVELAITQGAATSTTYTAEVFNAAPVSNTVPGTLGPVLSTVRYWNIVGNPVTAITSSTVQLSYDSDDGVTDNGNLQIAQGPSAGGGAWVNLGGTGTANTTGTITSTNALTDFSTNTVYTLAQNTVGTNPLPVEMTSFSATAKEKGIELLWNTASELNNAGFEIERNKNSMNAWEKIGFVEGNGTTNAPQSYRFSDNVFGAGKYQYRLKQIDRDGNFTYSNVVESMIALTAQDYTLSQNYPNPFNPTTTFSFAVKSTERTEVKVYNLVGQEVATLFNAVAQPDQLYSLTFDAKDLPSGIYFYSLRSGSRNEVKKMLLMK